VPSAAENRFTVVTYLKTSKASRGSAVGITTGYGLNNQGVRVRVPVWARCSLLHIVQTGPRANPVSCSTGIRSPVQQVSWALSPASGRGRGKVARGVNLTIYLELVPRARNRGSIYPLPLYVFTA
jgi:hypothetical protein